MAFYFWDENLKLWEALPTSIDTINNIATTETFEFGEFDLQAPLLCPMDDFEPDDNYHHAVPIETNETPVNRVVDVYDDEDWFFFEAASGMDYILHTDNYGANVDITIDLFDQDGLTTLDTEKINDSEKEQVVKWQAFQDGTYFVRISRSTSSVFGCDATYRFMMTEVGDKLNYLPIILNSTD